LRSPADVDSQRRQNGVVGEGMPSGRGGGIDIAIFLRNIGACASRQHLALRRANEVNRRQNEGRLVVGFLYACGITLWLSRHRMA